MIMIIETTHPQYSLETILLVTRFSNYYEDAKKFGFMLQER